MKREARSAVLILLGAGCMGFSAAAQNSAQQNVTVVVMNAQNQPAQPVRAVRVALGYLESAVLVTDAQEVTNSQGQALLLVSPGVSQRGDVRIEVTGATNLVIYEPADGQLSALPATVKITLLPKGSTALLGPAQIEAMLHRELLQVNSLRKQNRELKAAVAQAQNQTQGQGQSQGQDLGPALAAWAQANGFSPSQVDQQVQQWAQKIQSESGQATAEQKALAELALKHYASAAQLFTGASDADRQQVGTMDAQEASLEAQMQALQAAQKALLDKMRTPMKQLLDNSEQAAGAYQLNLQFHEATQALESAEAAVDAESKKHPDDKGFHELWLEAVSAAAAARQKEGEFSPASQSLPLLAQSVADDQTVVREYAALGDRAQAAAAQNNLGNALDDEGMRAGGDQSAGFFDDAIKAYDGALDVVSKTDLPQDWAMTKVNLCLTLADEGERTAGDKAAGLFGQAVGACQDALQIYSKANYPQDWARTQDNLGIALMKQGDRASGEKVAGLLDQAAGAFNSALEVRTQADLPQDWAETENNLGVSLEIEGERAGGDKAVALFEQAAQACKSALEVRTQARLPQDWAETQSNLGNALMHEGERSSGDKAMALFDQAAQAYQSALVVYTRAELPQEWARTQNNLGIVLEDEGEHAGGEKSAALLDQSIAAYKNALEVRTKDGLPQDWARTQNNLGNALVREGQHAGGDKGAALLGQAVEAYQNALEVRSKVDLPQDWANTENNLAIALKNEGERAGGEKAAALFDQAVEAYRSALEVFTKADLPRYWATTQVNLGAALEAEGMHASGDKAAGLFDQASQAYQSALEVFPNSPPFLEAASSIDHEILFRYDRALAEDERRVQADPSPANEMDLEEADLTAAHFDACVKEAGILAPAELSPTQTTVRDTIKLACQWGAGDKSAVLASKKALMPKGSTAKMEGWDFTGTLHFLSTSAVFEKGRASWEALFTAIENGDSAGMAAALNQLELILQQ